jgi:predicted ATPase
LRTELEFCERTNWPIWYPEFMAALAEGLTGLGLLADARAAVDKGLASADHGGERAYYPELLRLKGELLRRQAIGRPAPGAEQNFSAALCLARHQGALALQLRAALSFAQLRVAEGRHDEARRILTPIYDRFTEGLETSDLQAAEQLLARLR